MTIKELQTHLQTQINRLKSRSRNWLIALGVAIVLVIILLFTVFKRKDDNPKIEALEIQLQAEKARVQALEEKLPLYDSLLANQQRQLDGNKKTQTQIIHRYETIPTTVRDLTREQLDRELSKYDY
jgi:type II secretory pathway component PulM